MLAGVWVVGVAGVHMGQGSAEAEAVVQALSSTMLKNMIK